MGLVPTRDLDRIWETAIRAGLHGGGYRDALLRGIGPAAEALMTLSPNPALQLEADLNWCNDQKLADGRYPLRQWLEKAERLRRSYEDGKDFARFIEEVKSLEDADRRPQVKALEKPLDPEDHGVSEAAGSALREGPDFMGCCKKIAEVHKLKNLHDALHNLHFKCCQPLGVLVESADGFPEDQFALDDCEIKLSDTIELLRRIAEPDGDSFGEYAWIDTLDSYHKSLCKAVSAKDFVPLGKAYRKLNREVELRMVEVSTRLKPAAEALSSGADPEKTHSLNFRIELTALNELVKEHHEWQTFESELRRVGDSEHDIPDLENAWAMLKNMGERLYRGREARWATNLAKLTAELEMAFSRSDSTEIEQRFRRYRTYANQRFDQVDTDLKDACGKLHDRGIELMLTGDVR